MLLTEAEILNANILIVDDLDANVLLLQQLLSEAGYTSVSSTMNPEEVCTLHGANGYDLILLDLQMPVMDGFQVMEGLRKIEAESYFPVLAITAQPGHKLRALQAGAKDFISKPFDLVEVRTRIRNMLEVRLLYKKIVNDNKSLELAVQGRTGDLQKVNMQLTQEIEERKKADESLHVAYTEIKLLKERLEAENIYLQHE
ncbi:MAG: response regulator, partial [Desulfuromonadaceae bacterium]|nr:response regulator [Desulfuromonadaceae bacterium]